MAPIAMEVLQLTCPDGIFAGMMVSFSCARTVFQVFFLFLLSWMATGIFLLKSVKKILATWLQVRPCFVRSIPLFIVIFTTRMDMQFWCTPHFQRVTHVCQSGFLGTDGTYMHEDDRRRLEEGAAIAAVQL